MKKIKLGDVCQFSEDRTAVASLNKKNYISTENLLPDRNGIIDATTLTKTSTTPAFIAGNVLLSNIRPYFKKIWYATFDGGCSADVLVLKVNESIDAKFLYYALSEDKFFDYMTATAKGTKMPRGDKLSIMNYSVPEFPLSTQKKIATLLGALDDKIALNKKTNVTLEAMAKTLYDYWFVQFDFPDDNGKPYKTSGGKMIYNAELGQDIPDSWKVQNLSEITTIIQGNSPDGSTLNDTGEGTIFFQGKTDFGFRFPEVRIYTTAPYRLAEKFDTLLSVRAPVGDVNMAHEKCCIGRGLAVIHSDFPSFVYYMLKKLKPRLEKLGSIGTTFDSITKDDLMALKISMPSKKLVKKFENIVSKFDEEIFNKTEESRRLVALRDWLLPMLMNGQVTCK